MDWKKIFKEIGNIQLYKNGNCVIIWYGNTRHTYWDYSIDVCISHFKKKYGIKGKVDRVKFCPFILN